MGLSDESSVFRPIEAIFPFIETIFAFVETMSTFVEIMSTFVETMFSPPKGMIMPQKGHVLALASVGKEKCDVVTCDFVTLSTFRLFRGGSQALKVVIR